MGGLVWEEQQLRDGGAVVGYVGHEVSSTRFLVGVSGVVFGVAFLYLVRDSQVAVAKIIPVAITLVTGLLALQNLPGSSRGRIEAGAGRLRIQPGGVFSTKVDIALGDIDSFATGQQSQTYLADNRLDRSNPVVERTMVQERVYLYTREGRRYTLATFYEKEPALAMVAKLEDLVSRQRAAHPGGYR